MCRVRFEDGRPPKKLHPQMQATANPPLIISCLETPTGKSLLTYYHVHAQIGVDTFIDKADATVSVKQPVQERSSAVSLGAMLQNPSLKGALSGKYIIP